MIPIRDSLPTFTTPVIVAIIIALNVCVFLFQVSLDPTTANDFIYAFGLVPDHFTWITVFTSMFIHGGWLHLIGNMLFLWIFGDNIEELLGHGQFAVFYLLCGVAAAVTQFAIDPDSRLPMVGASGAIAGVMGAYLLKFPHARITLVTWFIILFTFDLPAWLMLLYWFGLQFFNSIGAIAEMQMQRGGTAFFAHVGGFIAGMVLVSLMKTRDRYRLRRDLIW